MTKEEKFNDYLKKHECSFTFEVTLDQVKGFFKDLFQEYLNTLPEKKFIEPEITVKWQYVSENKITVDVPVDERYRLKIYDDNMIEEGNEDAFFVPYAVIPPLLLDIIKDEMYSYDVNYTLRTKKYGKMIYITTHKNDYTKDKINYLESKFEDFTFKFDLGAVLYHVGLEICPELYPFKSFPAYKQEIRYKINESPNDVTFLVKMIYYGRFDNKI